MNLASIGSTIRVTAGAISTMAGHAMFKIKKKSPVIWLVGGSLCFAGALITTAMKSAEVVDILEDHNENMKTLHEIVDENPGKYTQADIQQTTVTQYVKTGGRLLKTYALPLGLAALGAFGLARSHSIMNSRALALTAAYESLSRSFDAYRERTRQAIADGTISEKTEEDIYYGVEAREKVTTIDENGQETETEIVKTIPDGSVSEYARMFDESNRYWDKNPVLNRQFIRSVLGQLNMQLQRDGYVLLNDAYRKLGFAPTKAGAAVGWLYDPEMVNVDGNCIKINFGIYDPNSHAKRLFVNGDERSVLLDFNVDGPILYRFRDR